VLPRLAGVLLIASLAAGCGHREVLVAKSAEVPVGIDFSGRWQLRSDADAEQRRLNDAIRRTDGVDSDAILRPPDPGQNRRIGAERRDHGGLVHVFLEHGRKLKITQTDNAIFISFDRAVVEEFRFGENRQVEVGPVIADRVSGWDGREYVVETLDENGMKLTERFGLGDGSDTLKRTIVLRGRNQRSVTLVQLFDRTG
jgi:hypothetical protein